MTPKQEEEYGITRDYLADQFYYENGELYKAGYLYSGDKPVGWVDASGGYRRVQIGANTWLIHRLIWIYHFGSIPVGKTVDHINHDRLDNSISNLRLATRSQQNKYQRKRAGCSSRYIGVCYRKRSGKFEVYVNSPENGCRNAKYLGAYDDEIEGARVRDSYILSHGLTEWNVLNFPTGKAIRDYE